MSSTIKLWCFLLLLPFFAVVGHDLYANFLSTDARKTQLEAFDIDPTAYQGSDLGYLLVKYIPGPYENARSALGEDKWTQWVDPVLRQYSFMVALVPALIFYVWLLIARIFDIWPFSIPVLTEKDIYGRRGGGQKSTGDFKYKRR